MILIKDGTIATLGKDQKVFDRCSILIENDKIKKIAPASVLEKEVSEKNQKIQKTIDARGKLVLPGFINAHSHFYSSFARGLGKAKPSKNFPEVLKNLWWRLDKKLSLEDSYYSALIACIDAIKHGTTTIIDHHASPGAVLGSLNKVADAVLETGERASLCYELSDRDGQKISDEGIRENCDFIKRCQSEESDKLKALFGLHASFTINDKTLEKAALEAKMLNTGFHVHTAEDISDQEVTKKDFGQSVVRRFKNFGILGPKTICAHCVHLDDEEIDLLKESNTAVVHNPQSNMNNAVGAANILKMLSKGILVGLGTDAMTMNMMEELRVALWLQKLSHKDPSVGFMECLNALVKNNAAIVSRYWNSSDIGEIKEGNKADIILIDYHSPTELSSQTFGGHLIFGVSQSVVDTTIVNGKTLMEKKELVAIDEERIMAHARELSKKLWNRF